MSRTLASGCMIIQLATSDSEECAYHEKPLTSESSPNRVPATK